MDGAIYFYGVSLIVFMYRKKESFKWLGLFQTVVVCAIKKEILFRSYNFIGKFQSFEEVLL